VKLFRTFFYYTMLLLAIIFALIPCFFLSLLPERIRYNKVYYFFMNLFYTICMFGTLLPIRFVGKENIPKGGAIYIANHQSALDVLFIGSLLDFKPHLWFFKKALLKIPLYGFMINRTNIAVDRSSPRKAMYGLLEAVRIIKDTQRSVIIFPEGGRYSDGKVHDFLWGFAIIARKTGFPVVPILIEGVNKVYPSGSFFLKYHPINVTIGKPYKMDDQETDEAFVQRVRRWFIEQSKE
jgi:1-acyl-sn-glycerol-3-phosphate acyltransferase